MRIPTVGAYWPENSDLSETDIVGLGSQILTVYNTAQIQQINIERAKQGLPPIDSSAIAPRVNVGLSPEIEQWVKWGLMGAAALAVLKLAR